MKIKVGKKYTLTYFGGSTFRVKVTKIEKRSDGKIYIKYKRYVGMFGWYKAEEDLKYFKSYIERTNVITVETYKEI